MFATRANADPLARIRVDQRSSAVPNSSSAVSRRAILPAAGAWEIFHDRDSAWNLVPGESGAAVFGELFLVAFADEKHGGVQHFSPALVGDSGRKSLGDGGVSLEGVLDLTRVDVLAAAHDGVVATPEHVQVAALVEPAEVAGVEPFVVAPFDFAEVAGTDDRSAHGDLSVGSGWRRSSVVVDDAHLCEGQWLPNPAAGGVAGALGRDLRCRLAQAVGR